MESTPLHIEYARGKDGQLRYLRNATDIASAGSGFFNTIGVLGYGEGFRAASVAVLLGILVAVLFAALWRTALRLVSDNLHYRTRLMVLITALAVAPFLFSVSTTYNVKAIAEGHAVELYMQQHITNGEAVTAALVEHAERLQGVLPDLRSSISTFEKAAKDELEGGVFSGSKGPGGVSSALSRIAENLRTMEESIVEAGASGQSDALEAGKYLEDMRAAMRSKKSLPEKIDAIAASDVKLKSVHSSMDVSSIAQSTLRLLSNLPHETNVVSDFSRNASVRSSQRDALAKLGGYLEETSQALQQSLEAYSEQDVPTLDPFERISGNRAIMVMWREIPAAWAAGITIDFMPYFLLFYLFISASGMTPEQHRAARARAMTIDEYIDHFDVASGIKQYRTHPDDVEILMRKNRGREEYKAGHDLGDE